MDNRSIADGVMMRVGIAVFGLLTVAVVVLAVTSDRGLLEVRDQAERLTGLEDRIHALESENSALIEEIQTLRTDPDEIERRAREELRLVRPGDVILVVPPAPE